MVHTLFLTDSRNFNPTKYMAYTVYDTSTGILSPLPPLIFFTSVWNLTTLSMIFIAESMCSVTFSGLCSCLAAYEVMAHMST